MKKNLSISKTISKETLNWSYGVMVSTLDFESNNPSSILGRTFFFYHYLTKNNLYQRFIEFLLISFRFEILN